MRFRHFFALAAAFLPLVHAAGAEGDMSFAYHGCLLDATGQVLAERNHVIEFCLYDQATGGSPLWRCTRNVLLDGKGQFSVELSGNAVSGGTLGALFAEASNRTLFLGLSVDGDRATGAEILPRQKLLSIPKAYRTADASAALQDIVVDGAQCSAKGGVFVDAAAVTVTVTNGVACRRLGAESLAVAGNVSVTTGSMSGNGTIPIGGIIVWGGAADKIPPGWALCNGQTSNGQKTPDLHDRFIVGAGGEYRIGPGKDGENTHRLTIAEMAPHSHPLTFYGAQIALGWGLGTQKNGGRDFFSFANGSNEGDKVTVQTGEFGVAPIGAEHENRPPYYALCYIMRTR